MSKKIGIMTWYQYHNYGTILQAYALSKAISQLGYTTECINYIAPPSSRTTRLEMLMSPRKVMGFFRRVFQEKRWGMFWDKLREEKFLYFKEENIPLTNTITVASELFDLNVRYDAFVCGSDQIWSLTDLNTMFYLDFVTDKRKMIAYAPSFGVNRFPDEDTKRIVTEQVRRFPHLSVREKSGAELLKLECGVTAKVMPDPTLLLEDEYWNTVAAATTMSTPYLLCYFLGQNEQSWKAANDLAGRLGLTVVVIPVYAKDKARPFQVLEGVGPREFLGLFRDAAYVCTDSFHGTVFSTLYKRPFSAFLRFSDKDKKSQNTRIYNFLGLVGLENRLYDGVHDGIVHDQINWDNVYGKLTELREQGQEYLKKALAEATAENEPKGTFRITNTCSGCGVCTLICPVGAVTMSVQKGFYQAKIEQSKCIGCGKCETVCAFRGEPGKSIHHADVSLFMARSTSKQTLQNSTSGGVAHEIARDFVKKGLSALGCAFDVDTLTARHILITDGREELLPQLQGSKYIQSEFITGFSEMLAQPGGVVFGCPCQIAGAEKFLMARGVRERFTLVDLICHGVPTCHLLRRHLSEIQNRYKAEKITEFSFRYKQKGWRNIHMHIAGDRFQYLRPGNKDNFYLYFDLQNCYMRSCYDCRYRTSSRADLRLGDYWGPKYAHCNPEGASMVISFSERGKVIFYALKNQGKLELHQETVEDYERVQFPINPIIPLYYEPLLRALEETSDCRDLKSLAHAFFHMQVYNRKLAKIWHKIKKK